MYTYPYDMAAVMSLGDYNMVAVMSLCDYDMGSCDEQRCSCQHGEKCECDEAEAVQHHGGELPVVLYRVTGFVSLHLVRQNSELLQDHCELPHRARWQGGQLLRLKEGHLIRGPATFKFSKLVTLAVLLFCQQSR